MIAQYIICPRPPPPPPAAPPAPPPRDVCMFQRRFFDHIARPLVIIEHISCPRPRGSEGCDHLTLYSTLLYYTILFSVVLYGIVVLYCAVSYYILTCRSVEDAPPASTRAARLGYCRRTPVAVPGCRKIIYRHTYNINISMCINECNDILR